MKVIAILLVTNAYAAQVGKEKDVLRVSNLIFQ